MTCEETRKKMLRDQRSMRSQCSLGKSRCRWHSGRPLGLRGHFLGRESRQGPSLQRNRVTENLEQTGFCDRLMKIKIPTKSPDI